MGMKATNPKDAIGAAKWRIFSVVPMNVIWELGVAMLEGALKYGRHNYRYSGVRASVYVDAAMGHITQWWEGEEIDPDSDLSHITKAIASLVVLRDAMMQQTMTDDRPVRSPVRRIRDELQATVDELHRRYPDAPVASEPTAASEETTFTPRTQSGSIATAALAESYAFHIDWPREDDNREEI